MNKALQQTALAAAVFGGLALASQSATAMPMLNLNPSVEAAAGAAATVESVRWVCDPYGECVWRHPHWRPYPVYGYGWRGPGPWGWHNHHHWHHGWYPGPYGY